MIKIILRTTRDNVTTTCEGVANHGVNELSIHGLSKRGKKFVDTNFEKGIYALTKSTGGKVIEVTSAPLP
jgi:hypothetical protein